MTVDVTWHLLLLTVVVMMMMVMVEKCWELVFFLFFIFIFIQLYVADGELSDSLGVGSRAVLRICACLSDSSASKISTPRWR